MRKSVSVLVGIFVLVTLSCDKDQVEPNENTNPSGSSVVVTDSLQKTGILGAWDIESQTINNIGGQLVFGQTLDFTVDPNPEDFVGFVTHSESGLKKTGTFVVSNDSLLIAFNSGQIATRYTIQGNVLGLTYTSGTDTVHETWRKQ